RIQLADFGIGAINHVAEHHASAANTLNATCDSHKILANLNDAAVTRRREGGTIRSDRPRIPARAGDRVDRGAIILHGPVAIHLRLHGAAASRSPAWRR